MQKSLRSDHHQTLQNLLKQARADAGLTQQQLADKLKKPQSFIAKYEGGERRLDVVEFIWVCEALDASPDKILRALIKS